MIRRAAKESYQAMAEASLRIGVRGFFHYVSSLEFNAPSLYGDHLLGKGFEVFVEALKAFIIFPPRILVGHLREFNHF